MRPVDLQGIITRTQDIEKLQRVQQHNPAHGQAVFSEHLKRQSDESQSRVNSTPESDRPHISDGDGRSGAGRDERGEGQSDHGDRDQLETSPAQVEHPKGSGKGRFIDVKV